MAFAAFPLLLPEDEERGIYHGYVSLQGKDHAMRLVFPPEPHLRAATSLECSHELRLLLQHHLPVLQQRLMTSFDVHSFLVEFSDVVERQLQARPEPETPPVELYLRLVADIELVGWSHIAWMHPDLTSMQLQIQDGGGRKHVVSLKLPASYPQLPPLVSATLPEPMILGWSSNSSSLVDVKEQFRQALLPFQMVWNELDDVDSCCCILEPDLPAPRSSLLRRIALGNHSSLQVTLDWKCPRAVPECRFLGSDSVVGPLKERLNANLHHWDGQASLRTNLQRVLLLVLPSPATAKSEDISSECGICYSYRLGDAIPDVVCENARCNRPFHPSCLAEWLRSTPNTRQTFGLLTGTCPYCSTPMRVPAHFALGS